MPDTKGLDEDIAEAEEKLKATRPGSPEYREALKELRALKYEAMAAITVGPRDPTSGKPKAVAR